MFTFFMEIDVCFFTGERELRARIKDLIRYRKNGITKLAGIFSREPYLFSNFIIHNFQQLIQCNVL